MNRYPEYIQALPPGHPSEKTVLLRRKLYRRNLLAGIGTALLLHLIAVLVFILVDYFNVDDLDSSSGPVLVKIGIEDAPPSPKRNEASEPEVPVVQPKVPPVDKAAVQPPETAAPSVPPEPEAVPPAPEAVKPPPEPAVPSPEAVKQEQTPAQESESLQKDSKTVLEDSAESPFQEAPEPKPAAPASVKGSEDGNNYLINFEGSDSEVGRAAAYDYITSYMPLPEILSGEVAESAYSDIAVYWEKSFDKYIKKAGNAGKVPLDDRPYYWEILRKAPGLI